MSTYQIKFSELFLEFTRYLTEHPDFAERIPPDAEVVLLDARDPEFSREALRRANRRSKTEDMPDRPVVFVEVGKLKPVRSRLSRPRIAFEVPAYAR